MSTQHEKILKRPDGTRVKIIVSFWDSRTGYRYDIEDVRTCAKGKRTWVPVQDSNCYSYRRLSLDDRAKEKVKEELKVVTKEEVLQAKLELWEKLKPTM